MGLFDEETGIFKPIYRNRTTAWMQKLEQRRSSCRVGQSILGQPPGKDATLAIADESYSIVWLCCQQTVTIRQWME